MRGVGLRNDLPWLYKTFRRKKYGVDSLYQRILAFEFFAQPVQGTNSLPMTDFDIQTGVGTARMVVGQYLVELFQPGSFSAKTPASKTSCLDWEFATPKSGAINHWP